MILDGRHRNVIIEVPKVSVVSIFKAFADGNAVSYAWQVEQLKFWDLIQYFSRHFVIILFNPVNLK